MRLISRAESWEKVYTAFANINFAAFDYNTVKQSIIDYVKLYFPENFNDFIESSEFIAIIESFAYIAELMAYRIDVTTHENFISTAQRRDSILKLAKLISYKASRPLPARGLVKITSVTTTETLIDSNGINLAGRAVRWNDTTNPAWKDQFILVLNRVLDQDFGSVVATDRFQIQDVLFELYPLIVTTNVMSYNVSVYGQSYPMELVPVAKSVGDAFTGAVSGIVERRPQQNAQFTILYGSDGLGDASETTGLFFYTKQGTLQRYQRTFDGITPNQFFELPTRNVNDTDVWVNNVDPDTGDIVVKQSNLPYRRETVEGKYGEWVEVDLAHSQNVIFNTNPKRNKYEVETIRNNGVRLIFGDGEFADIPSGLFDVWVRTSVDDDVIVPQASIVDTPLSFTYTDVYNQVQTFQFTISLIGTLQNASAAETTEHIRETAPSVYYTQDRMVNGEDYNVYMRQNPTILKLRAINRTFAGDSKYITWHDSSNSYENVKMFSDDGIVYYQDSTAVVNTPVVGYPVLISTYIEPLLSSTDIFTRLTSEGVNYADIRRVFNADEKSRIETALIPPPNLRKIDLYYNTFTNEWHAVKLSADVGHDLTFGGYNIVNINGYATSLDTPITYDILTFTEPYAANFTIGLAGGTSIVVEVRASNAEHLIDSLIPAVPATINELLSIINDKIAPHGCVAELLEGNIIVRVDVNYTTPQDSWVEVDETVVGTRGLFSSIILNVNSTLSIEPPVYGYSYPTNFIEDPIIFVRQLTELETSYTVSRNARRVVVESQTLAFWNVNDANRVVDYDTLRSADDKITILQANTNCNRTNVLQRNWVYNILGQELVESGSDIGMADIHRVAVIADDENQDNVPDNINVDDLDFLGVADFIEPKITTSITVAGSKMITLPVSYIVGFDDIRVHATNSLGVPVQLTAPVFELESPGGVTPITFGVQIAPSTLGWVETDSSGTSLPYGEPSSDVMLVNVLEDLTVTVYVNESVYFQRISTNDEWLPVETTLENIRMYSTDYVMHHYVFDEITPIDPINPTYIVTLTSDEIQQQYEFTRQWKRHLGRNHMNISWMHFSPRYQLVDPSPTNIVDIFIITRGYFIGFKRWLEDPLSVQPDEVTPLNLRNDYNRLLENKMVSDTVILHPGKIKLLFGDKAIASLRAKFKIIRSANSTMTDNQIKNTVVATVRNFFDIASWEFGETFYFTELASAIHLDLSTEISSVVLVPTLANSQFGNLFSVTSREDEILYPDVGVEDIEIITGFTPTNMRLNG